MSFRLVPKSMTVNDIEWRRPNGRYFCVVSVKSVAFMQFRGALRKPKLLPQKCTGYSPKLL